MNCEITHNSSALCYFIELHDMNENTLGSFLSVVGVCAVLSLIMLIKEILLNAYV